ncbi:class I SAM-dependent methyltransferase [Gordonia sp. TBRC 11910]|uniref:Class I SAM-dependent methyltransferase n=1 Tax=Gordonia asplenii TaxID=2725283 RepID=A0A848L4J0_9ACTN|nr:class I SAM-dependent methyltransferase [Gordonia asplenii]NMO03501.1 class I SAM-dependent methyltransferase [Gordonia asplenii]
MAEHRLATVDGDGVSVGSAAPTVVDVLFDDTWVWSFQSGRDTRRVWRVGSPNHLATWPQSLRPYLRGTAHVTVRERTSARTLFDDDYAFDDSGGRVSIVDRAGRPLTVDKAGDLQCAFAERGQATIDTLLDAVEDVLGRLTDAGVDAFLAYGALLGAVREGRFIAHDSDADVAYLSRHRTPVEVMRESFALERLMIEASYWTWRFSAGDFKVIVPDAEGGRAIDVFAGFVVEDVFYLLPEVASTTFRPEVVLPLGKVELHGRSIVAPNNPEALLEITYGPGWRVPDPSFKFDVPRWARHRLDGWFRGNDGNHDHWWPFYFGQSQKSVPTEPSAFARWVDGRESPDTQIVDIGTGTGRDALWFARQGHQVLGLDYVPAATERAGILADEEGLPARFKTLNLYDARQVLGIGGELAHRDEAPVLYGRFLIHALQDAGRKNLWRIARMALRRGGRFYLEFRTGLDADAEHEFGEHFRRYLEPDAVVAEIEEAGGRVEYCEAGHGFAVYKQEDPHVCRLVATWRL